MLFMVVDVKGWKAETLRATGRVSCRVGPCKSVNRRVVCSCRTYRLIY